MPGFPGPEGEGIAIGPSPTIGGGPGASFSTSRTSGVPQQTVTQNTFTASTTVYTPTSVTMGPLIDFMEGWEHQQAPGDAVGAAAGTPNYAAVNTSASITYGTGRLQGSSIHIVESGAAACNVRHDFYTPTNLRCGSLFFKRAAAPSVDSSFVTILDGSANNMARFFLRTNANGNTIEASVGTSAFTVGATVNDANWHQLEFKLDTSGTTWTLDWRVDGSAQTQVTEGTHANTNSARFTVGSIISTHTLTIDVDDAIFSATAADYDSRRWGSSYQIKQLAPTGEGTDVLGTTNPIINQAAGNTNLYQTVDEFPATTADYTTYTSTTLGDAASNYAEYTLADHTAGKDVWAVEGYASVFASATTANAVTIRVVDSTNATLANILNNGDCSETALRHIRVKVSTAPAGGWADPTTGVDGCKIRFGFASNVASLPRLASCALQIAEKT